MPNPTTGLYPIRTVSEMTGVNAVTLRAWERRYGLIRPSRTDKGHRLYTPADVDRINNILQLMEEGVPISRVSGVLDTGKPASLTVSDGAEDTWQLHRAAMLEAIVEFNDVKLDQVYNEVLSLYPHDLMTRRLLLPLLEELGRRWEQTSSGVAEEHFFAVYLRNKLGARLHHRNMEGHGPRLVLACLPKEHHEIGLLLFALAASDRGFRPLVFGSDMPLSELASVAERTSSAAIIVSSSVDPDEEILSRQLPELLATCSIPVFAGGSTATRRRDRLEGIGIKPLGDDISKGIKLLQESLRQQH